MGSFWPNMIQSKSHLSKQMVLKLRKEGGNSMNQEEVKKILHDQLQLIAERSKEADTQELAGLTSTMVSLMAVLQALDPF